ncbi:unnamed protein product, partial [Discosporangium mesarthrocarpum]
LGRQASAREPGTAFHLFVDFSLPRLVTALQSPPEKRRAVLTLLYCFAGDGNHCHIQASTKGGGAIKRLKEILPDMDIFIQALAVLIHLEDELSDSLVDLYSYYSSMGIGQASPSTRAGAVGMLPPLLEQNPSSLGELLPTLVRLANDDKWWEVQAQLLVVACSVLESV